MLDIFSKNRTNDIAYGLDVLAEKNRQISRNIANVDTPMYRAKKLEFDEVMGEYFSDDVYNHLYLTNEKHLEPSNVPHSPLDFVRRQNNMSTRTDGNDVNIDYEMSQQAESSIMYTLLTEMVGGKFGTLKEIIRSR